MNIRLALLKEHSKKQTNRIAAFIETDKQRFSELMRNFLGNEYRVTQRAAWAVSVCSTRHPELIRPWLKRIIVNLSKPSLPDAVKRNTVRILQFISIPPSLQGLAAEHCFRMLQSIEEPIAVKVFSMTVLLNLCKAEPGLTTEVRLLIERQMPQASKGFVSRGSKILKELKKIRQAG